MAQYPPPSNYFSGINYNNSFYSSTSYILKSGDYMTGTLTAPNINVNNNLSASNIIELGSSLANRYLLLNGSIPMTGTLNLTANATDNQITITNSQSTRYASIKFLNNINSACFIGIGGTGVSGTYVNNLYLEANNAMVFNTGNQNTTSPNPRMIIDTSGNVGIGTPIPSAKLDIQGNVNVNGNLVCLQDYSFFGGTSGSIASATGLRIGKSDIFAGTGNGGAIRIWSSVLSSVINLGYFGGNGDILTVANTSVSITQPTTISGSAPKLTVKGSGEGDVSTLYLSTPFQGTGPPKCALIAEGLNTYSRSKFHISLNNTPDNGVAYTAGLSDVCLTIDYSGNMGLMNKNPISDGGANTYLNIGNSAITNSAGYLVIHKKDGGAGSRHFRTGVDTGFYYCFGDFGSNNTAGTWVNQFTMHYACPQNSLLIDSLGRCYSVAFIPSSDAKIKTDIFTIPDALLKVSLLRGVYYTNILDGSKNIGLIAQEVEGVIPEVVSYNKEKDLKGVNYNSLVGLLINAIKEQQEIIENQGNQIKNILDILNRNNIK